VFLDSEILFSETVESRDIGPTTMTNSGTLIATEVVNGSPIPLTYELLGLSRRLLPSPMTPLCVALFGDGCEHAAGQLIRQGVDHAYLAEHPIIVEDDEDVVTLLLHVVEKLCPALILFGHTPTGSSVGPRLAFRLNTGIATDCEDLRIENDNIIATRSCYGGKAMAEMAFRSQPAVVTIRAKSQEPVIGVSSSTGTMTKIAVDSASARRPVRLSRQREKPRNARLENAKIVVAGGRGLNEAEGFRLLESLADTLDAALGASRVACDLGWCPTSWQIGLTGKTITPDLYMAVGISGASQHIAGCAKAKTIVAINTDPNANIFKIAHFGIVADYKQVVPSLIENIKRIKSDRIKNSS
jgi:electron transfer flavoprotein alpha subunit